MSEWIERVAAAMAEKANGGRFSDPLFYAPEHKEFWLEVVRAGMEEFRKPSEKMCKAPTWDNHVSEGDTEAIWKEMIDAEIK